MKNFDVLLFTQTMSSLLKSGLSLQNSLKICAFINRSRQHKELCSKVANDVDNGMSLSESLSMFNGTFSDLYISLVKIGEKVGTLDDVFDKLAEYLKSKKEIHEKTVQSLIYPLVVLFTSILVVLVTLFFVYPRLETVFDVFTENSQEITSKIKNLKLGLLWFCSIFLFIIAFFLFVLASYKTSKNFRLVLDKVVLNIPVLGRYIKTMETNDFSFAMKILCSSFIPFSEAMAQAKSVTRNTSYKKALDEVYQKIISGSDIAGSFEEQKIFPEFLIAWIKLAQNTGKLDEAFSQIYEYYNSESKNISSRVSVAIEPLFILIAGIFVFLLVFNFVLPIFNLLGEL